MSNEIHLIKISEICFFRKLLSIRLIMQPVLRQIGSSFTVSVSFAKTVMYLQSQKP